MKNKGQESPKNELDRLLRSFGRSFGYIGLFSLFINLLMLTPSIYMLQVYDRVLASRSNETLLLLTLILVWFFITLGLLEYVRSRILVRLGSRFDTQLCGRVYQAMMGYALQHPGETRSQPVTDLNAVRQFLAGNAPFAFFDTPWIPIYLGLLFLFHPYLGWFSIFAALVLLALAIANELTTRGHFQQAANASSRADAMAEAQLLNAEALYAMGMQPALQQRWLKAHLGTLKAQAEASDRAGLWMNLSKTLRQLFQSLMLGLGAWLAISNEISSGMVIAGSILMGRALAPVDQLIGTWKQSKGARAAYRRLNELLNQIPSLPRRLSLPPPAGHLRLEAVSLIPPGGRLPVLKGVDFFLNAGETLVIFGPSAAGKSSLMRAIVGVWPLATGKVRLDGAEIGHWNREELGPHIGYLPQDIELFEGTVAENIARFGDLNAERIVDAARLAGVDEMVRQLAEGYETRIGVNGVSLSGGQRQRLGLARALYGDPRLVILDEPNANLDEQGEASLLETCRILKERSVTLVMVSHRRGILQLADKLLLLAAGQVNLFGERDAVLQRMVQLQQQARLQNAPRTGGEAAQEGDEP
ncbi:MAG: type I secretion system permease/ATPase [Gammaproteobacteria bacterium]|nr:type I secretion system permease/ATPase [Gammaproteobacteria bacterium]MBU1653732.1 type I secretion system permease/ATPase [Gammaproteobacteria bacterium]MBU1959609.1 type I secretion system permease/ATPase [Gammaproteobacteria bacterium]